MSFLGDFHFIRPAWLLLAPVVVGVWWLARQSQDPLRGWRAVMDPQLLEALTVGRIANPSALVVGRTANPSALVVGRTASPSASAAGRNSIPSYFWRGLGLLTAWLLAVVAVAGPTWRPEPSPFADDPVPVMLVLKASETMNQSDLMPNRMERARLKVADLAAERKGQPLGLVTYAGTAHLVLPPTRDTSVVATMGAEISPEIMPKQGDDLAGALQLAANTLGDSGGSIVVFADTVAEGADSAVAEFHSKNHLPVYFLAIARADTPEYDAIRRVASTLKADVTLMTPDTQDVRSLARSAGKAPVAIGAAGEGTRWAEAGWWLVPLVALLSLISFRRVRSSEPVGEVA